MKTLPTLVKAGSGDRGEDVPTRVVRNAVRELCGRKD